jgi:type VI secretion system protein ImpJ
VRFRLLRQRDLTDAYAVLGAVRVVERRDDGQVVLDRGYIAPQTRIEASGQLSSTATLLHSLVQQKARQLASQMGQMSHGISELADFMMLLVLNRAEPRVAAVWRRAQRASLASFYLACLRAGG